MRATVSQRGSVTIPKALRTELGIRPGSVLEFEAEDGHLIAHVRPKEPIADSQAWFLDERWQQGEREASKDIAEGRSRRFESDEEFLESLD